MNAETKLLTIKNLRLGYQNHTVIKNLSFEVMAGDFLCIVSPNGAGKTTLINAILGLKKPKSGKIILGRTLKRTEIGFMPQEAKTDANFPATVSEIVLSGTLNRAKFKPFYKEEDQVQVAEKLELLKIADLENQSFADLSGGQKQKVLLARALAATAKLLILDEPSNNLDADSKKDFFSLLTELNRTQNLTIILITHDLDHDNLIGNKILSIKEQGFFGKTEDFVRLIHHEKRHAKSSDVLKTAQEKPVSRSTD